MIDEFGGHAPLDTQRLSGGVHGVRIEGDEFPVPDGELAYKFHNHDNIHVHGYKERGNINTPLELAILNEADRFTLVIDVIDRVPGLAARAAHLKEDMRGAIIDSLTYAHTHGIDRDEITNWVWPD